MKEFRFTRGLWVVNPDGPIVCVEGEKDWPIVKQTFGPSKGEALMNAHLIAAAPELYTVARICLMEWERSTSGELPGTLIARLSNHSDLARKALLKAVGK